MMSDPERMKRNAERTPEERKKRMAEVMTMQAKKYGFEDAKGFMAALKKYEDDRFLDITFHIHVCELLILSYLISSVSEINSNFLNKFLTSFSLKKLAVMPVEIFILFAKNFFPFLSLKASCFFEHSDEKKNPSGFSCEKTFLNILSMSFFSLQVIEPLSKNKSTFSKKVFVKSALIK